jgi:hypothetical protein
MTAGGAGEQAGATQTTDSNSSLSNALENSSTSGSVSSSVSKRPTSAEFISLVRFLREDAKVNDRAGPEQVKALVQANLRRSVICRFIFATLSEDTNTVLRTQSSDDRGRTTVRLD